jgi:hypothetical protein
MPFAATLLPCILDTVLGRLALLFLSGAKGDLAAARHAAAHMLAAYGPETEDELRLAAEIVTFSFQALEALSLAATPEMPLNKILRLRSGAVSLSRESHKAQRRLDQIQKARREGIQPQPAAATQPEPARPQVEKAIALVEATRPEVQATGPNSAPIWSKPHAGTQPASRPPNGHPPNGHPPNGHPTVQPPAIIASQNRPTHATNAR